MPSFCCLFITICNCRTACKQQVCSASVFFLRFWPVFISAANYRVFYKERPSSRI